MATRKDRREIKRLIEKGIVQIGREDYRYTKAIITLISATLEHQSGLKEYLESITPPETVLDHFILEGFKSDFFSYYETGNEIWLCQIEENTLWKLGTEERIPLKEVR